MNNIRISNLAPARLALMAATGAGAEIASLPPIARSVEPDAALKDAFDAGHARYRAAQTAITGANF